MEPSSTGPGSAFVRVDFRGVPVSDAIVTTEPATDSFYTDVTGTVLLPTLAVGNYRVKATKGGVGSGASPAVITSEDLTEVNVVLVGGVFDEPTIQIEAFDDVSLEGTPVYLRGTIRDDQDSPETLTINLISSLDGELGNVRPTANGFWELELNGLSVGEHVIRASSTDSEGLIGSATTVVRVNPPFAMPTLTSVTVIGGGARLVWEEVTDERIEVVYLQKSTEGPNGFFAEIARIQDRTVTEYVDDELTYGQETVYRIAIETSRFDYLPSNTITVRFTLPGIDLGTGIVRLITDPERPYLYGLDATNNNLLFINVDEGTIEKSIYVGSSPRDLSISLDGSQAFVANYGSTLIGIVDLDDQELVREITVNPELGTWDGNPYRLVCLADGLLAFTSLDQWNNIKVVNVSDGSNVQSFASVYYPGLLRSPDGRSLYISESGSTGSNLIRYDLENGEFSRVSESAALLFGRRDAHITAAGDRIFYTDGVFSTNNLANRLGSFAGRISAITPDGSVALTGEVNRFGSEGNRSYLYDTDTFTPTDTLPLSGHIAAEKNGTFYLYHEATSALVRIDLD